VPHGIIRVFNTILYENEFQNLQIFQKTISLFPEQSALIIVKKTYLATVQCLVDDFENKIGPNDMEHQEYGE
jgi:hypothetical protein